MADFKKLLVWQKAHAMSLDAERVVGRIRGRQHSNLKYQLMRAAESVPTNIVEGAGEQTAPNFSRFLRVAINSTNELEYHIIVATDRKAISPTESLTLKSQVVEVRKMLYGLRRYLAAHPDKDGQGGEKKKKKAKNEPPRNDEKEAANEKEGG
jgi:four helix bundle protein